jgi:hypothetical protein
MVSRAYMPAAWMDPGLRRDDVRACVGPRAILYASGVISQRRHPRGGGDLSKHRVERTAPLRHSLRPSRKRRVTSTRCAAWRSHRRHEKRMRSAPAPGAVVSKEKAAPWRAPRAGILNRPGQYGRCLTPPRVGTLCALITGRFATPGPRAVTPLCRRRSPAAHPQSLQRSRDCPSINEARSAQYAGGAEAGDKFFCWNFRPRKALPATGAAAMSLRHFAIAKLHCPSPGQRPSNLVYAHA